MKRAYTWIVVVYAFACLAALATGLLLSSRHPLLVAAAADAVATVSVFAFSLWFDNSSVYDPYWSVAPVFIGLYWALGAPPGSANLLRQVLVGLFVALWAGRLTANWALRWKGLRDEDWRYVDRRRKHGRAYWAVSFLGIHLMPTLLVYLGCLSLFPALASGSRPLGPLDLVAALVTGGAVWLEARADTELRRFRASDPEQGEVLCTGVWSWCRHPNYLGQVTFWWGLYLFGLAADPGQLWTVAGPLAITCLFCLVSIPMMEERMQARCPAFAAYQARIPALIPWPARRRQRSVREEDGKGVGIRNR
jgi:steroid 5-alpha reductase family enzyme